MRHVGHFDDHASAGRDPQRPQHAGKVRGTATGACAGQTTRTGIQDDGVGRMVALQASYFADRLCEP